MNDDRFAAYETKWAAVRRLEEEILPGNKQAIFDALVAAGIQLVTVDFDAWRLARRRGRLRDLQLQSRG